MVDSGVRRFPRISISRTSTPGPIAATACHAGHSTMRNNNEKPITRQRIIKPRLPTLHDNHAGPFRRIVYIHRLDTPKPDGGSLPPGFDNYMHGIRRLSSYQTDSQRRLLA